MNTPTFYSQQGEDCYIYINYINNICSNGIFVELGGMDGERYSNTKFFEDNLDFTGILIEPTSQYDQLKKNRSKCKCYKNAIYYKEEDVEFIGEHATAGLTSTMNENFKNSHHKNTKQTYMVKGCPIHKLLKDIEYIDLFSIDVEGGELVVLETMNWNIPVYIIIIELDSSNKDKDEKCRKILRDNNFDFDIAMGGNEFWVNKNYERRNKLFNPYKKIYFNNIFELGKFKYLERHLSNEVNEKILNKSEILKSYKNKFICEDYFTNFVINNEGLVITRKSINKDTYNYKKKNSLVCLTGYPNILDLFFTNIIHSFIHPVTVIIIESDVINLKTQWLDNSLINHCYTWNKSMEHPKLSCLPIGLNFDRQHKIMDEWLKQNDSIDSIDYDNTKWLAVNNSPQTNSIRGKLSEKAKTEWIDFCDVLPFINPIESYWEKSCIEGRIKINVSNPECYDIMKKYKFILSPAGAGEDTHRTWEALYVGCIPIVQSSHLNELYEDLPVLVIKDWNVINKTFLEEQYKIIQEKKMKNEYKMEKIYLDYWLRKIRKPVIHFMTYANSVFQTAKERLIEEAAEFNEFKTITGYGPENLPSWVNKNFENILSQRRGGGYWLWRPFIIDSKMKEIEDGEYIVFLDAGCKLNTQGKERFNEYINELSKSKYGILSIQMSGNNGAGTLAKEKEWTINEIFQYLNINQNSEIKESGQYLGGVFILKKNKHSMNYVKETIKTILTNPLLITDDYNGTQENYFKENRHEQSVTSVLRKVLGSVVVDGDESWMVPFGKGESLKYPFWATRSRQ